MQLNIEALQQMADERLKSLEVIPASWDGNDVQIRVAKEQHSRIHDELAMLQAALADVNKLGCAKRMNSEELEAHAKAEAQRQADILAERAAMRLNDVRVPYGEEQAYWKSEEKEWLHLIWETATSACDKELQAYWTKQHTTWEKGAWNECTDQPTCPVTDIRSLSGARRELHKAELRADLQDLEEDLRGNQQSEISRLREIVCAKRGRFALMEQNVENHALRRAYISCADLLDDRRLSNHTRCKECMEYKPMDEMAREKDGRIARHQRCQRCA